MKKYAGPLSIAVTFLGIGIGLWIKFPALLVGGFLISMTALGFFVGKKLFPVAVAKITE